VKRMIKVLAVAVLVALILGASVSPVLGKAVRGGVLLQTTRACEVSSVAQNNPGSQLLIDPPGRATGCWVVLPSQSAT
jgi:hypothetical protein